MSRHTLILNVMKKNVLLLALLLSVIGFANTDKPNSNKRTNGLETSRYGYMEPFKFIERGIEFYVFPNGEFDFNTRPTRRGHSSVNISYGAPRNHHSYNSPRGVRIEHDHYGRVRRVGNVFINYDRMGKIKRIGSVYVNYHHSLISNIGGLYIYYNNHHRIIRTRGVIKYSLGCHFCGGHNCSTNHYDSHNNGHYDWNNDHSENDWGNDDMYYYRKNNSKKKKR